MRPAVAGHLMGVQFWTNAAHLIRSKRSGSSVAIHIRAAACGLPSSRSRAGMEGASISLSDQRPSKAGCDNVQIIIRKFEAVRFELDPQIEVISTHLVDV